MQNRILYFGDNLEILRDKFPEKADGDGYFDLIYLDPPFNSNRDYNVLFKEGIVDSPAQVQAFEDSWHWTQEAQNTFEELVGARKSKTRINEQISNLILAFEKLVGHNDMLAYLTMMTVRLIELRRVLKNTGSIYLHCDSTASHYLKIVMDAVFEKKNFRNEIVWKRGHSFKHSGDQFPRVHDVILLYSKSTKVIFNKTFVEYEEGTLRNYTYDDNDGRGKYRLQALRTYGEDTIKKLEEDNRIYVTSSGKKWLKQYLAQKEGKSVDDFWGDIRSLEVMRKEQLGYPTQKPEALLERIINASSNEGDWVLDPFCGCGTTVAVSEMLNRKWVGIDITSLAINLVKHRLQRQFRGRTMQIYVDGLPKDLTGAKSLFKKDPWEFEYWALDLVNAMPAQSKSKENMRGADKGVDGIIVFAKDIKGSKPVYGKLLVQVKGGNVQRSDIATLKDDVEREKADGGLFITLEEPTRPMREEAISAGKFGVDFSKAEFPKIQIITIKDLLAGSRPDIPFWTEPYYKEAKTVGFNPLQNQAKIEFL